MSGQFADHLADPDAVEDFCTARWSTSSRCRRGRGRAARSRPAPRDYVDALRQRRALVPLVREYQRRQAATGRRRLRRPDAPGRASSPAWTRSPPSSASASARCCSTSTRTPGTRRSSCCAGCSARGHPVTAVGDPFQSIYGWRGASAGNMGAFDITFPRADAHAGDGLSARHQLPQRPRDPRRRQRRRRAAAHHARTPCRCARTRGSGAGRRSRPRSSRPSTTRPPGSRGACARPGTALPDDGSRTAAVLVRRRSQLPALADALHEAGLPVEIVGLGGLLTTPEVVDVVATLRVLGDYKPGGALMRLLDRRAVAGRPARPRRAAPSRAVPGAPGGRASPVRQRRAPTPNASRSSLVEALDDPGPLDRYSPAGGRRIAAAVRASCAGCGAG